MIIQPGQPVCDCWYDHTTISHLTDDGETIHLTNGRTCTPHCLSDPTHCTHHHPSPIDPNIHCVWHGHGGH